MTAPSVTRPTAGPGTVDDQHDETTLTTITLSDESDLPYAKAVEITERISHALIVTEGLILQAYVGRAWKAMGYPTWDAWIDAEFGMRPLLLVPREDRNSTVIALRQAALSTRTIARILGICEATVRRELNAAAPMDAEEGDRGVSTASNDAVEPDEPPIMGRNGKKYRAHGSKSDSPSPTPESKPTTQRCEWCEGTHPTDDCPFEKQALGIRDHPRTSGGRPPAADLKDRTGSDGPGSRRRTDELSRTLETSVRDVLTAGVLELPRRVQRIGASVDAWVRADAAAPGNIRDRIVGELGTVRGHLARAVTDELPTAIAIIDAAVAAIEDR